MNHLLLETRYKIYLDHLHIAFKAIEQNTLKMPIELFPNEMFHPAPRDCWDIYENEKFLENYEPCVNYWNTLLSIARRIKKLEMKRIKNKMYCNKSDNNIKKLLRIS